MKNRVLVVDDEVLLAETLRDMLVFHGYDAQIATNGVEACEILKTGTINLVISDIRMPMMDGMQLLKHINESYKGLPVILISGFSDYDAATVTKNGGQALVPKPMDVGHLLKLVDSTLERNSEEKDDSKKD